MNQRTRIGVIGVVATVALGSVGPAEARSACSKPGAGDILCRKRGLVSVGPLGASAKTRATRSGTAMPAESAVHIGSRGSGRALFARQASCDLGGLGNATDLVTRYGGNHPLTDVPPLFWQQRGDAACRFRGGVMSGTKFFCKTSGDCPLKVYTDGTYLPKDDHRSFVRVGNPQVQAGAAQAGTTTNVARTSVSIDFCAGRFVLDYVDGSGQHYREVDSARGRKHVRAEIEETQVRTTTSGTFGVQTPDGITVMTDPDGTTTTTTVTTDPNGTRTETKTVATPTGSSTVTTQSNSSSSGMASASAGSLTVVLSKVYGRGACAVFD